MKKSVRIITNTSNHVAGPNLIILKNVLRETDKGSAANGYREIIVTDALTLEPPTTFCDINVHMDCLIPAHFTTARTNVLLANMHWYSENWNESMKQVDFVLVKTREAEVFFKEKGLRTLFMGWRGEDAFRPSRVKGELAGGQNAWLLEIQPTPLAVEAATKFVQMWSPDMPYLHLAGFEKILNKINTSMLNIHKHVVEITRDLDAESQELAELRNTCKTHIHVLNSGCPASPYVSLSTGARCVYISCPTMNEILPQEHHLCLTNFENSEENKQKLKAFSELRVVPRNQRMAYIEQIKQFRTNFSEAWRQIESYPGTSKTMFDFIPTAELPAISIITPTYNRKRLFKLAVYNFLRMDYPRDRVQWIIVDDSDEIECVKSELPDVSGQITYIRLDAHVGLAEKRNRGIAAAHNSIIVHMDDDDYYPSDSVRIRVSHLIRSGLDAVTCTTLPMYDLRRYSSAINVPPFWMSMAERCSEATFAFKKAFWEERQFDKDMAEGETFLAGRLARVKEITPAGIIVSMLHSKNAGGRGAALAGTEANGNHYGFSDNFFKFLHSLEPESLIGQTLVAEKAHRPDPDQLKQNYGVRPAAT